MSGVELYQRIKKNPRLQLIPVILIPAQSAESS
jgi:CheY-like chemotaxis protein